MMSRLDEDPEAEKFTEEQAVMDKLRANEQWLDAFRGCLIGGAVGDALGYPIEFLSYDAIMQRYGVTGITRYKLTEGKAQISDDTQMTLFTANGILLGATRSRMRGIAAAPESYIHLAYLDWLTTQTGQKVPGEPVTWLSNIEQLHARRAPGNTCLGALQRGPMGTPEAPLNSSKGCGGIMRVAPIGLYFRGSWVTLDEIDMIGARAAAITHGHPLGFIPAAALAHIIHQIVYCELTGKDRLQVIVADCITAMERLFAQYPKTRTMTDLMRRAAALAQENVADIDAIKGLGEGWVAEETLAIALYCCLRYEHSFEQAVVVAVNHSGDSDSTGAVAGNVMGALVGYDAIPEYFKEDLELSDVILEIADDLCHACQISEYGSYRDETWEKKYLYHTFGREDLLRQTK